MKPPRIVYHQNGKWVTRLDASREWHDTKRLTIGKVKRRRLGRGGSARNSQQEGGREPNGIIEAIPSCKT